MSAEEPALSANAGLRLLAWTVADARGATRPLEKPMALTVGKRLDRQAQSVRGMLFAASDRAAEERLELQSRSPTFTEAARADIDARERAVYVRARICGRFSIPENGC